MVALLREHSTCYSLLSAREPNVKSEKISLHRCEFRNRLRDFGVDDRCPELQLANLRRRETPTPVPEHFQSAAVTLPAARNCYLLDAAA